MKIVVFEAESHELLAFEGLKERHDVRIVTEPLNAANVAGYVDAEVVSTFIYSKLDRSVREHLPSLRLISTRSTSFEHIETTFCSERAITVSNVPTYGENTVAEHVFALLLTISHRILDAVDRATKGQFSPRGLQGFDLAGKTLGVIGTGRIARGFESAFNTHEAVQRIADATIDNVVAFSEGRPENVIVGPS